MTRYPVAHLSASSISDWLECPLRWYGRRVAKWPESPSVAMLMGIAMHAGFEAHHRGQDCEAAMMRAWESGNVAELNPPPGALQRAFDAIRAYREYNPRDRRDRPEVQFSLRIDGLPVPIIGRLDLIRGDDIHELKSGKKTWWTQDRVDAAVQPSVYWLAYHSLLNIPPARVVYHIVPTQPVLLPAFSLETTRTAQQLADFRDRVLRAWSEMTAGKLRCGCRPGWCSFPEQCAAWAAREEASCVSRRCW